MRKILSFLLSASIVFSLCACGSESADIPAPSPAAAVPAPTASPVPAETVGIIGERRGGTVRFDSFGLTATAPEGFQQNWMTPYAPATFKELDSILEESRCCTLCWKDYSTDKGPATLAMLLLDCEEGTRDSEVMDWYNETFPEQRNVTSSSLSKIRLGDYPSQKCYIATYTNDDGETENFLVFDRICGRYRIECQVFTYGWEGAEQCAKEIFAVDAPDVIPLECGIDESGLLVLSGTSAFGKDVEYVREAFGDFDDPAEFTGWGDMLYTSDVDMGSYVVSLFFDEDGLLYALGTDGVDAGSYDATLKDALDRYILFDYFRMEDGSPGNRHRFYVDENCTFAMNKTRNSSGGMNIYQCYYNNPFTDENLTYYASSICEKLRLRDLNSKDNTKDYTEQQARALCQMAVDHGFPDAMGVMGNICSLSGSADNSEALRWYEKGAEAGSGLSMNNLGLYCMNGWAMDSPDYDRGISCFLDAIEHGENRGKENLVFWSSACSDISEKTAKRLAEVCSAFAEEYASEGSIQSMCLMGYICKFEGDYEKAVEWFEKGIDARGMGSLSCSTGLGMMYADGTATGQPDFNSAAKLLSPSTSIVPVQNALAKIAVEHGGELSNETKAALLAEETHQCDGGARNHADLAGILYEYLYGDYARALKYYSIAVEEGYNAAQKADGAMRAANIYLNGLGLDGPDYEKAAGFLIPQAERNNSEAEALLKDILDNHRAELSEQTLARSEEALKS